MLLRDITGRQIAVTCGAFFLSMIVEYYGILYGILKPLIESEYDALFPGSTSVRTTVAAMGAVMSCFCLCLSPIGASLVQFIGCRRQFIAASMLPLIFSALTWFCNDVMAVTGTVRIFLDFLAIGIATGIALGALFGPPLAALQKYFPPNKRGIVTGIAVCGGSFATLVLGVATYQLTKFYSWRGVFMLACCFCVNGIAAALAYIPLPSESESSEPEIITLKAAILKSFRFNLFQHWHFICVLLSAGLNIISYIPVVLLMTQASAPGSLMTDFYRSLLLVFFGLANLAGRFTSGFLADFGNSYTICTPYSLYIIAILLCAIIVVIFAATGPFGDLGFIVYAISYGFCCAPTVTLRSLISECMFGVEQLDASFGWLLWAQGIFFLVAFPLTDWLNSIDIILFSIFISSCLVLSSLFMAFTYRPYFAERKRRQQQQQIALNL